MGKLMNRNKNSKTSSEKNSLTKNNGVIETMKASEIRNSKKPKPEAKKSKKQFLQTEVPADMERGNQTHPLKKIDEKFPQDSLDLPNSYSDHRLVLIARDPQWAFCFWEIDSEKIKQRFGELGNPHQLNRWKLRVYCHTDGNIEKGKLFSDSEIDLSPGKIYLELFPPGSTFTAELGVMDKKNNYCQVLTSNSIDLPPDNPSENHDEVWTNGKNIEEVYQQSSETLVKKLELSVNKRSIQSFGKSSASVYKESKK